ncbi:hypothetical protein EI171_46460 [Bradyrhizobium sp. LCT2]|nr:hypothetical protein EI171_46460 [Bradyrhizobium sp. LCT2]
MASVKRLKLTAESIVRESPWRNYQDWLPPGAWAISLSDRKQRGHGSAPGQDKNRALSLPRPRCN